MHNHVWRVAYADLMPAAYLKDRSDGEAGRRWAHLIASLDAEGRDVNGRAVLVAQTDDRLVDSPRWARAVTPS